MKKVLLYFLIANIVVSIFAPQIVTRAEELETETETVESACSVHPDGHVFNVDSEIIATKASCKNAETHYLACECEYNPKDLNYVISVGKKKDHNWIKTDTIVLKKGTCNGKTNGYHVYTCNGCKATKNGSTWKNAIDHKKVKGKTSSCHTKCAYCGKCLSKKHVYNVKSNVIYTYATTKSPAKYYYKCSCGYNPKSSKYVYSKGKKLSKEKTSFKLDIPYLSQNPSFPNGCEAVSLTSAFNYLGYNISAKKLIYNYLPMGRYGYTDPYQAFIGDPASARSGWGCFAPAIVKTANGYLKDKKASKKNKAINLSHKSFKTLAEDYLLKYHRPVIVWASIDMRPFRYRTIPIGKGKTMTWRGGNHCLLLIGWNKNNYIFMDPMRGIKKYKKSIVKKRYKQNDMQAVFIMPQN